MKENKKRVEAIKTNEEKGGKEEERKENPKKEERVKPIYKKRSSYL